MGPAGARGLGNGYSSWTASNSEQTLAAKLTLSVGQSPEWIDLPATAPREHGDFAFHGALGFEWRPSENTTLFADLRHGQNEDIQDLIGAVSFYESHVVNSLTINFHRLELLPSLNLMAILDVQRVDCVDNAIGPDRVTVVHTEPSLTTVHALAQVDASQWGGRNTISLAGETYWTNMEKLVGARAATTKVAAVLQNETLLLQAPRLLLNLGGRIERVAATMEAQPVVPPVQPSSVDLDLTIEQAYLPRSRDQCLSHARPLHNLHGRAVRGNLRSTLASPAPLARQPVDEVGRGSLGRGRIPRACLALVGRLSRCLHADASTRRRPG